MTSYMEIAGDGCFKKLALRADHCSVHFVREIPRFDDQVAVLVAAAKQFHYIHICDRDDMRFTRDQDSNTLQCLVVKASIFVAAVNSLQARQASYDIVPSQPSHLFKLQTQSAYSIQGSLRDSFSPLPLAARAIPRCKHARRGIVVLVSLFEREVGERGWKAHTLDRHLISLQSKSQSMMDR